MTTRNLTRAFLTLRDGFDRRRVRPGFGGPESSSAARATTGGSQRRGFGGGGEDGTGFRRMEDDEETGPLTAASSSANDAAAGPSTSTSFALPPRWVDVVDAVDEDVREARKMMNELAELHKKRLMVRFEDDADKSRDAEIQSLTRAITRKLKDAEKGIMRVGTEDGADGGGAEEAKVRLNVQRLEAAKVQDLSLEFRRMQKQYMSQVAALSGSAGPMRLLGQSGSSSSAGTFDDPLLGGGAANGDSGFGGTAGGGGARGDADGAYVDISEGEIHALATAKNTVRDREREIQKIAQSIEELATIFRSLATLVIDQGSLLDRIDANMELVVERTQRGVQELDKAAQYADSNRLVYCVTFLVVTILVLLGIEVAKLS